MTLKEKIISILSLLKSELGDKADKASVSSISASVAPDFSTASGYARGDFCMKGGVLYKCTTAHPAGSWNSEHFTATTVAEAVAEAARSGGGSGTFDGTELFLTDQGTGDSYVVYVKNGNLVVRRADA